MPEISLTKPVAESSVKVTPFASFVIVNTCVLLPVVLSEPLNVVNVNVPSLFVMTLVALATDVKDAPPSMLSMPAIVPLALSRTL